MVYLAISVGVILIASLAYKSFFVVNSWQQVRLEKDDQADVGRNAEQKKSEEDLQKRTGDEFRKGQGHTSRTEDIERTSTFTKNAAISRESGTGFLRQTSSQHARALPTTTMLPPSSNPRSQERNKPINYQNEMMRKPPSLNQNLMGPPPSQASSLRIPLNQASVTTGSTLSTSTLAPAARSTRKVILSPGHSPLDWAHLTSNPPSATFLRGSDVPPMRMIRVTPSMLRKHNGRHDTNAWGAYRGKVYNLSPYLDFHPGGKGQLMKGAGQEREGERLFNEVHPWINWEGMLSECMVGILVAEDEPTTSEGQDEMENMD